MIWGTALNVDVAEQQKLRAHVTLVAVLVNVTLEYPNQIIETHQIVNALTLSGRSEARIHRHPCG